VDGDVFRDVFGTQGKHDNGGARELFCDVELPLITSLNRYIEVVTESEETLRNSRHSRSLKHRSAYSAVGRLFTKAGAEWSEAQRELRKATLDFTLTGNPSFVMEKAATLIEYGVASVDTDSATVAGGHIRGKIDEPLIVQASINYFGFEKSLIEKIASTGSESEKGNCFEQFVLPSIQARFSTVLASQLKDDLGDLEHYTVPKYSSYGVLALDCKTSLATMEWIKRAMASRFEGLVEPFCYPGTKFGPDVVFLMGTSSYDNFRFVASQAKLKNPVNEAEVLRTVVPELFYHRQNRHLGRNCSTSS